MLDSTKKIISDIKDIKIQGATNIVLESTIAIESELKRFKGRNIDIYFDNLLLELWKTRPTEPALKTFLTHFKLKFNKFLEERISKSDLITFVIEYRENLKDAVDKIADDFANSLKKETIIFTHCHSSIVEKSIIAAHKKGKIKYVVNTETRPLYQGRITSKKLADAGISVRHIVDSGAYAKAKNILEHDNHKSILFLTGADVITNKGDLINKIGTCQISLGLNSLGIKHYVMTIASKIDAVDRNWNLDKIELRSPDEIWISKDKNIKVLNYAFDITPAKLISKIFTENGCNTVNQIILKNKLNNEFRKTWESFANRC